VARRRLLPVVRLKAGRCAADEDRVKRGRADRRARGHVWGRVAAAVLAAGLAVYVLHVVADLGDGSVDEFNDLWLYNGLILGGGLAVVARAVLVPRDRLPWAVLAAGLLCWSAGELLWSFHYADQEAPPYPGPADALWLSFYPAVYVTLILLARRRLPRVPRVLWLDGLIGALAAAAMAAAVLYAPILTTSTEGSAAAVATNLAYPVADLLLLLFVILIVAFTGWRPGRMLILLGGGIVASGVADALYLHEVAVGTYVEGGLLDILWPVSVLLLALAAWQPAPRVQEVRLDGLRLIVMPVAGVAVAVVLLVVDHYDRLDGLALFLSTGAVAVAIVRMALTFRANARMLEESRAESITDALTGLGNRRKLMEDVERAADDPRPHLLVLFDLDGFKRYNDTFGHPAGDALLARLGGRLGRAAEPWGEAYRMGGDEFCVLAAASGDQADAAVAATSAALSDSGRGFEVHSSHGTVELPREAASAAEALHVADQRMYRHKSSRVTARTSETRDVLLRVLREREPDLVQHLHVTAGLAREAGRRLGLAPEALDEVVRAAELLDVGKMAIPDSILAKPGPLDDEEWAFMRRHTVIGEGILSIAPALVPVARLVRSSHERYDGGGYPDGLAGSEIPLGARIVFVCDAFDAMTADRPYRGRMSADAALRELRAGAGSQFDPDVVEAFAAAIAEGTPRRCWAFAASRKGVVGGHDRARARRRRHPPRRSRDDRRGRGRGRGPDRPRGRSRLRPGAQAHQGRLSRGRRTAQPSAASAASRAGRAVGPGSVSATAPPDPA